MVLRMFPLSRDLQQARLRNYVRHPVHYTNPIGRYLEVRP